MSFTESGTHRHRMPDGTSRPHPRGPSAGCVLFVTQDPPHGSDGVLLGDVRVDLPQCPDRVFDLLGSAVAGGFGVVDRLFDDVSDLCRIHHGLTPHPFSQGPSQRSVGEDSTEPEPWSRGEEVVKQGPMVRGLARPRQVTMLAARAAIAKTKSAVAAAIIVGRLMNRQGIVVSSMKGEVAASSTR